MVSQVEQQPTPNDLHQETQVQRDGVLKTGKCMDQNRFNYTSTARTQAELSYERCREKQGNVLADCLRLQDACLLLSWELTKIRGTLTSAPKIPGVWSARGIHLQP